MSEPKKNWKDDLPMSKKIPDMPKNSDWKKWFNKFGIIDNREKPVKEKKPKKELKKTPLKPSTKPLKRTPLKQVGARKKARISEHGTESIFFLNTWIAAGGMKEKIYCACGCWKEVKDPFIWNEEKQEWKLVKPQCFAHILPKGLYEKFRYLASNIDFVATIKCHHKNDEKYTDLVVRKELEQKFDTIISSL
jgi:hypothetical protein